MYFMVVRQSGCDMVVIFSHGFLVWRTPKLWRKIIYAIKLRSGLWNWKQNLFCLVA
jgi:hypothetical protein